MIIKNAKIIVEQNKTIIQDILIKNNKIQKISNYIKDENEQKINVQQRLILPGGIDVHTHLREPGFLDKETIKTGSRAAARGGYTTILAMPNINPHPDNPKMIERYLNLIKQESEVNVFPYACITMQSNGKQIVDIESIKNIGINWLSDDGVGVQSVEVMREALLTAYKYNVMICAHAEDMKYRKLNASIHEGIQSKKLNLIGIPNKCEYEQIKRDLQLALETKAQYHICHMSTKESVDLLDEYKKLGTNVSGEVTPHHLLLIDENIKNANYKMNPPLRSEEDRQALINGLLNGTIDMIASDHAPHTEEEKRLPIAEAPSGVVGLETSIPLIYTTFVKTKILTLEMFQNIISKNPATRFGFLKKGQIKVGYDADLICLNEQEKIIDKQKFISKGKNTPFDGYKIEIDTILTIVNGEIKYIDQSILKV